jgi:hypothetical protein
LKTGGPTRRPDASKIKDTKERSDVTFPSIRERADGALCVGQARSQEPGEQAVESRGQIRIVALHGLRFCLVSRRSRLGSPLMTDAVRVPRYRETSPTRVVPSSGGGRLAVRTDQLGRQTAGLEEVEVVGDVSLADELLPGIDLPYPEVVHEAFRVERLPQAVAQRWPLRLLGG